ncbi:MAG: hypothetical protein GVY35_11685 [Bacteroidetes bacterium]|jgi:hypothetical protein|nr:hypothetical protein [Bacteroidota bacterium]
MEFSSIGELVVLYLQILLLALLVERVMEVLMSAWEYTEWKQTMHRFWNRRARRLQARFETQAHRNVFTRVLSLTPIARQARAYTRADDGLHRGNLVIIDGTLVRRVAVTVGARLVASLLGVLLCWVASINFVALIRAVATEESAVFSTLLGGIPAWLQIVISGVLIGLGTEPVHRIIQNLERRREQRVKRQRLEQAQLETAPSSSSSG